MEEHVTLALPLRTVTVPVGTQDPTASTLPVAVRSLVQQPLPFCITVIAIVQYCNVEWHARLNSECDSVCVYVRMCVCV